MLRTKFINNSVFLFIIAALSLTLTSSNLGQDSSEKRPRARDIGVKPGILSTGKLNAITDVDGVKVGHKTIIEGQNIRTGVTAILPHGGNTFRDKVAGAVFVGNGFGKLIGSTQIEELGEIETPILLTSTLAVPKVGNFLIDYMLALPGNENVRSINPVVAETNDGYLNDIRARRITRKDVFYAIKNAQSGTVVEGAVGAGTGTIAFGWKGGIGTSSRKLPVNLGGYTVGVLVQSNFGGVLKIDGAPVGVELGKYYMKNALGRGMTGVKRRRQDLSDNADGSIIIVVATDAPVDARNLKRMAARTMMGLARTGSAGTNGSGDYSIAFSTAKNPSEFIRNNSMSPLFLATIEATEEAIYNSLFRAHTMSGQKGRRVNAIPLDKTVRILKKYKVIQ